MEDVSFLQEGRLGRPADTPQWGRSHAPIKSRRSALTAVIDTTHERQPLAERHGPYEPDHHRPGSQPPQRARGLSTLTLTGPYDVAAEQGPDLSGNRSVRSRCRDRGQSGGCRDRQGAVGCERVPPAGSQVLAPVMRGAVAGQVLRARRSVSGTGGCDRVPHPAALRRRQPGKRQRRSRPGPSGRGCGRPVSVVGPGGPRPGRSVRSWAQRSGLRRRRSPRRWLPAALRGGRSAPAGLR